MSGRLYIEMVTIATYDRYLRPFLKRDAETGVDYNANGYTENELMFFWSCPYREADEGQLKVPAPCAEIYLEWKAGTAFKGLALETVIRLALEAFNAEEASVKFSAPPPAP